ncbi:MAG: thioesterase [Bacteroidetes bacterium]|nr:MAG: thioesterase [Bacteroidota bacterium]
MEKEKKKVNKIRKLAGNHHRMRIFFLKHLPMAFFAGLKITEINREKASVTVPYKYLNKNPFRSVYFAVLSMAAELSTGILAMAAISDFSVPVSMLVLEMKASFTKKARTRITFTCNDGINFSSAVARSIETNEGQTAEATAIGYDEEGDEVARFTFTWTFKPKQS